MTGILKAVAQIVNGAPEPEPETAAPYRFLRSGASNLNAATAWLCEWRNEAGDLTWKRQAGEGERKHAAGYWLMLRLRHSKERAERERWGHEWRGARP